MKSYNTAILTLILVALIAIAGFLYKIINEDMPITIPSETTSERPIADDTMVTDPADTLQDTSAKPQPDKDVPEIIGPPITKNTGAIEGKICYPSEYVPAMNVFVQNVLTKAYQGYDTEVNQNSFAIDELQPGKYVAFAYPVDSDNYGGGYTEAVPCGLTVECTDHALIQVEVGENKTVSDIDICDWYGAEIPEKPEN